MYVKGLRKITGLTLYVHTISLFFFFLSDKIVNIQKYSKISQFNFKSVANR